MLKDDIPPQKRQPLNFIREQFNEIVFSMCTVQCGCMEAKTFNFGLHTTCSEHHQSLSTRRVFTYVVGGRVGMNDTCYFSLDM